MWGGTLGISLKKEKIMKNTTKILLLVILILSLALVFTACGKKDNSTPYKLPSTQFNQTYTALDAEDANNALTVLKASISDEAIGASTNYGIFGTMVLTTEGTPVTTIVDAVVGVDEKGGTLLSGYTETSITGFKAKGNMYVKDGKIYSDMSAMGQKSKTYLPFADAADSPYSKEMFDSYLEMIKKFENLEGVTLSAAKVGDELQYKFSFDKSILEAKEIKANFELVKYNDFSLYLWLDQDNTVKGMRVSIDYAYKYTDKFIQEIIKEYGAEAAADYIDTMAMKLNFEIAKTDKTPTFPNDLDTYVLEQEIGD